MAEWPDAHERAADQILALDRPEERRVLRVLPVVAEHVVVVRGDLLRSERARLHTDGQVRLVELAAVDVDLAVAPLDRLAGQADEPLHEVLDLGGRRALGRLEDDDVAATRVVQLVAELVDEHAVADLERRDHRLGRDVEGLEDERADDDRDDERGDDEDAPLHRRPAAPLVLFLLLGPGRAAVAHRAGAVAGATATTAAAARRAVVAGTAAPLLGRERARLLEGRSAGPRRGRSGLARLRHGCITAVILPRGRARSGTTPGRFAAAAADHACP